MTTMLSSEALTRARDFVDAHARPLEQVRLRQVLGEVGPEEVADALAPYQVDGGSGRMLESDCRAPEASALATLTALDVLRSHDVPGDHPLKFKDIQRMLLTHTGASERRGPGGDELHRPDPS